MFHDLMLKFADEDEAKDHLYDVQVDADGMAIGSTPRYFAIDMIGPIGDAPEWHVNVRHTAEAPELDAFVVSPAPTTPLRVWA